jgi:hypothetical protein
MSGDSEREELTGVAPDRAARVLSPERRVIDSAGPRALFPSVRIGRPDDVLLKLVGVLPKVVPSSKNLPPGPGTKRVSVLSSEFADPTQMGVDGFPL